MSNVKVIYGSTTGATEAAARLIADLMGASAVNVADAVKEDFSADLLILGTSTWGFGDLQDDWAAALPLLESCDFSHSKFAFFGLGDQYGFSDTYVNAMGTLCDKVRQLGGTVIGKTSAAGYAHTSSSAQTNDEFCGLALDENNEAEKTSARVADWVEVLKKDM